MSDCVPVITSAPPAYYLPDYCITVLLVLLISITNHTVYGTFITLGRAVATGQVQPDHFMSANYSLVMGLWEVCLL